MNPSNTADSNLTRAQFLRRGATTAGVLALLPALSPSRASAADDPAVANLPPYDLRDFVRWITEDLEPAVRLPGPAGTYARDFGSKAPELYGAADMACALYTIGALHPPEAERREWAGVFGSYQNPATGFLAERNPSHTLLHNTAYALAAMQLFDLLPPRPPQIPAEMANIRSFLGTLDWRHNVYIDSHKGAGLGSVYALSPSLCTSQWFHEYFSVCESLFDPNNGLMGLEKPPGGDSDQIGGSFHYSFLFHHFNRRPPYPERRIDTVLRLQQPDGYWDPKNHLWMTLDAIYLMTRTVRYAPYRVADVAAAVRRAMDAVMRDAISPEGRKATFGGRLAVHSVTAAISIAAELQQFFGADAVRTDLPLHLVLDRRPFI
jgi:hypothetical protein